MPLLIQESGVLPAQHLLLWSSLQPRCHQAVITLVEENAMEEENPQWLLEMEGERVDEFDLVDNSQPAP